MPRNDSFTMPTVEIGDVVLYHLDGSQKSAPAPAIVTKVAAGNISLSVIEEHRMQLRPPTGVMHVDDPRMENNYNDAGAWEHTPFRKRVDALLEENTKPAKRGAA